jgi:hypothetical protein
LLICVWSAATGWGLWSMLDYEFDAAPVVSSQSAWPEHTRLSRDRSRPTLLMFVHPRCPCSRASLAELERLQAECGDRVLMQIIVARPAGLDGAENDSLMPRIRQLPSATIVLDEGGREAQIFGAAASGETLLFSASGELLFRGGITASRGHEGESVGRAAIASLIHSGNAAQCRTPVFGCGLLNRSPEKPGPETLCQPSTPPTK